MKNKNLIQFLNERDILWSPTLFFFLDINESRWDQIISGQELATIAELKSFAEFFNINVETIR